MSLFDILEEKIDYKALEESVGFEMNPIKDKYKVIYGDNEVCIVEFVNNKTDFSDDYLSAEKDPEDYVVYISEVKNEYRTKKYIQKLNGLNFENISLMHEKREYDMPDEEIIDDIEPKEDIEEAVDDKRELADALTRLLIGNRESALRQLKDINIDFDIGDVDSEEYNRLFYKIYLDIKKIIERIK